jgi:tyrosinase
MDSANPSHARGRQWRDDFLGGNGDSGASNMVPGGPFRHTNVWPIQRRDPVSLAAPLIGWVARAPGHLTRTMAQSGTRLPSTDEVDHVVNRIPAFDNNYFTFGADGPEDSTSASFRAALEGFAETDAVKSKNESQMHNGVHVWVGGMMGSVPPAPNDPVFWLHHCNIDRIWALWQVRHPALATQYPTDAAIDNVKVNPGPSGFTNPNALKLDEPQTPWDAAGKSWPTPAGGPPLVTDVYTIRDVLNWSAMRAGLGGVQFEGVNARAIGF